MYLSRPANVNINVDYKLCKKIKDHRNVKLQPEINVLQDINHFKQFHNKRNNAFKSLLLLWTQLPELGWPQKIVLFQAKFFLALTSNFLFESMSLAYMYINFFSPLRILSLSVCKFMLFGHTLMFLHFFGHPRLSGSLQESGMKLFNLKPLQIAS